MCYLAQRGRLPLLSRLPAVQQTALLPSRNYAGYHYRERWKGYRCAGDFHRYAALALCERVTNPSHRQFWQRKYVHRRPGSTNQGAVSVSWQLAEPEIKNTTTRIAHQEVVDKEHDRAYRRDSR